MCGISSKALFRLMQIIGALDVYYDVPQCTRPTEQTISTLKTLSRRISKEIQRTCFKPILDAIACINPIMPNVGIHDHVLQAYAMTEETPPPVQVHRGSVGSRNRTIADLLKQADSTRDLLQRRKTIVL